MKSQLDIDPAAFLGPPSGWRGWLNAKRRLVAGRAGIVGLSALAVVLGANLAGVGHERTSRLSTEDLQLERFESDRLAGELALERLTNFRLQAIHDYSTRYRIPAGLAASIYDVSLAEGLEPDLAFRLVEVESGFRRTAVSEAGAVGYTQVKPSTAYWLDPTLSREQLFDVDTNLRLGFRYLSLMLDDHDQDMRMALLAYNRGPARVGHLVAMGRDPSNGYASRILRAE